mmetsp:Transcript_41397/g.101598  ORF Transcript_41397/g.101598 Transcript_41397/m.101598 type:complete len:214 (-) Transcript_41397:322-963(-)
MAPWQLPRLGSFLFCISLKIGAYSICVVDCFLGAFDAAVSAFVLCFPSVLLHAGAGADAAVAWPGMRAVGGLKGVLATGMIAAVTACLAGVGAYGVRAADERKVQVYCNWKGVQIFLLAALRLLLHSVWWDGCKGVPEVCVDRKMQFVAGAVVGTLLPLYLLWVCWSLCWALQAGDETDFLAAGYDITHLQARREQAAAREELILSDSARAYV